MVKEKVVEITLPPGVSEEAFREYIKSLSRKPPAKGIFRDFISSDGVRIYVSFYKYLGEEVCAITKEEPERQRVRFKEEDIDKIIKGLQTLKSWLSGKVFLEEDFDPKKE